MKECKVGDEENKNRVPENRGKSVHCFFPLPFLGLLKDSELFEGPTSLTGRVGGRAGSLPRILKRPFKEPCWQPCRASWFHQGTQLPFLEGWLSHSWCYKLCNHNARKSWENPTKWNCICLWSSWDSKFGQWNLVGKWETHQGLHSEPKIYRCSKWLFPERPASCGNVSAKEERGEGPLAHCWCDQPVKIFEQMEKSKLFHDAFQITAHQDGYEHLKSTKPID